jgi:hypothetical protein
VAKTLGLLENMACGEPICFQNGNNYPQIPLVLVVLITSSCCSIGNTRNKACFLGLV